MKVNMTKGMKNKVPVELTLIAKWTCPNCEENVQNEIDEYDIDSSESPCELCGAHGCITVDIECPQCKKNQSVTIREW